MQLRRAEMKDGPAIAAVINAAFRRAESFFIDGDRINAETVGSLLQKGKFLLLEEGAQVLGCVYLEPRGERVYLGLLSVDPKQQKKGLGSMLMNAAEDECAQAGFRFMDLRIVNLRTENQALYRSRGYIETGTEPFPSELNPKMPCHFVKMSKPLR